MIYGSSTADFPCGAEISGYCGILVRGRQNLFLTRRSTAKHKKSKQNGGGFDKPLFWMHFCALRSLLSP